VPSADKRERQRQNRDARRVAEMEADKRQKRNRAIRNGAIVLGVVVIIFVIVSLTNKNDSSNKSTSSAYTATIDTSEGTIVVGLDSAQYPTSVQQFATLAKNKFYDGLLFNRVAKDFVIQTGSPNNTTSGGSGSSVVGEVPTTTPAYPVGAVAFAKGGDEPTGTADSQFFIVTGSSNADLPADYAGIGTVSEGLDVAQAIGKLYPASGDGAPTKKVTIKKITIAETPGTTSTTAATTTTAAP
jgi:cyclophilin family peptidyl-prolyl cis-trans isomerase